MKPTLSIIVPVYKVEEYIHKCITSILNQTFTDFELILVDDGSPDNCGTICDEYAQKDGRIIVIHQNNQGLSGARNAGLEIAKGEYITFVDSDDSIATDTYSDNMEMLLNDNNIDVLEFPYKQGCNKEWELVTDPINHIYSTENIFLYWALQSNKGPNVWSKIFKRNIFSFLRFPKGVVYEDLYIMPDIAENISHLYVSNKGTYIYNMRNNSISGGEQTLQKKINHCNARLRVLDKIKKYKKTDKESIINYHWWISDFIKILKTFPNENLNQYIIQFESINYSTIHILTSKLKLLNKTKLIFIKYFGIKKYIFICNLLFIR